MQICRIIAAVENSNSLVMNESAISEQNKVKLILASASPRRRELLMSVGCQFSIRFADIDESRYDLEEADQYVERLAYQKAKAVLELESKKDQAPAVLAADTIVVQKNKTFGKPEDKSDAFAMWDCLKDTSHHVVTGVCLLLGDNKYSCEVKTRVEFTPISKKQMQRYWESGEPLDKAGAYAIQGLASAWVKLIHGSYSNVVGLPLKETNELLTATGHNWL